MRRTINKLTKTIISLLAICLCGYVFLSNKGLINDPLHILTDFDSQTTESNETVAENNINTDSNVTSNTIADWSNTRTTVNSIEIPQFDGENDAYILNNNEPFFTSDELAYTETYINFSNLDTYGRAGVASAVLGQETMQTHDRGSISDIHPSGWWEAKQTDINVNRSHLIGNNLYGDITDCSENMITGSRQLNAGGTFSGSMLQYEIEVADYLEETGNHVRYRVSPVFENNDVTCKGVLMEAESMEDGGTGLKFCVYIYNVQDGYTCDYQTGVWEKITTAEVME